MTRILSPGDDWSPCHIRSICEIQQSFPECKRPFLPRLHRAGHSGAAVRETGWLSPSWKQSHFSSTESWTRVAKKVGSKALISVSISTCFKKLDYFQLNEGQIPSSLRVNGSPICPIRWPELSPALSFCHQTASNPSQAQAGCEGYSSEQDAVLSCSKEA